MSQVPGQALDSRYRYDQSLDSRYKSTDHTARSQKNILRDLPEIFDLTFDAVFAHADENDAESERCPFGHLKYGERTRVFETSLEKHVLRRFDELKIPARAMWEEVRRRK